MIITRTPLRISFIGGGSDLPAFYNKAVGRVISTAINKYIFVAINEKFDGWFRIGYSTTEIVKKTHEIKNTRVRAALEYFKIKSGLEIVSVADIPSRGTGLGSSSSFAVGVLAGLSQHVGNHLHKDRAALAEAASHLEINMLGEPIGKQDQYAAAYGGLNMIEFHPDRVVVTPVAISKQTLGAFRDHLMVFYTGVTRSATSNSQTLTKNLRVDEQRFLTQQKLADLAIPFRNQLLKSDFNSLGEIMHDGWLLKKKTSDVISTNSVDELYATGRRAGAWGGKLLGAGGGGFMLFIVPPEKQVRVRKTFSKLRELSVGFDNYGCKVIFNRYEYL